MPHKVMRFMKSSLRILGLFLLMYEPFSGIITLVWAEVLNILATAVEP